MKHSNPDNQQTNTDIDIQIESVEEVLQTLKDCTDDLFLLSSKQVLLLGSGIVVFGSAAMVIWPAFHFVILFAGLILLFALGFVATRY